MKLHRVYIDDKTLYQFMIADLRYSFPRDNGLASNCCINNVEEYLPKMSEGFQDSTAKQLIEETITHLKWPEGNGAHKHKCKWYNKATDAYRTIYISDYEYNNKKLISERVYKFEDLEVDPTIVFEDEQAWLDFIFYLSHFVNDKNWKPYNDDNNTYYKGTE